VGVESSGKPYLKSCIMASGYSTPRGTSMQRRRAAVFFVFVLGFAVAPLTATGGLASIKPADLKTWLTYVASDELQGRQIYSEGLGLTAGYIQAHLDAWGVKPAGDRGGYLQAVRVLGVKTASHSSVTVQSGAQSRTFKDGEGITFARNVGGRRTLSIERVEFIGYGLDAPGANHFDLRGKDLRGAAVVFVGPNGPKEIDKSTYRRLLNARSRYAIEQAGAAATIGPVPVSRRSASSAGGDSSRPSNAPDFTTVQRLDRQIPPAVTASDEFFEFLFANARSRYDEMRRKAEAGDDLPSFHLDGVRLTFTIDADYTVIRTQLTNNVVAVVEGSDPQLKSTYVAFGAHYDHVGYAQSELADGRRPSTPGKVTPGHEEDRIWNGADDDGSGTVALMALARAFAEGAKPKRSLLFVWHAGEESGLYGSRYFADYPSVPLEKIVAQLNIDMVGRNRDDKPSEADTVYLVGSDRISSELHQINRDANRALPQPLTLNYEMNDPGDLEQIYTRSDHYSYASKGIPIIFFTTGLHADYHANTDEIAKIEFPKLVRITQLVYETGVRLANLDHAPARDNKGPRAGRDTR
jgi:Peptidase family M28